MKGAVAVTAIVAHTGAVVEPVSEDFGRLVGFRAGWYGCLTGWADTLFEAGDAVLCAPGRVPSLPYLSLEPVCRRGWGSVYAALAGGRVDAEAARDLLAAHLPRDWWPVFAVDVTVWPRPEAFCSPRRGMCRVPDPAGGRRGRAVPGWAYSWVCQVSPVRDSWTAPVDVVRVDPDQVANEVAAAQMRALTCRLARGWPGVVPMFCLDAGYCPITATLAVTDEGAGSRAARVIVRIRKDRVFYTDPPPARPGMPGRPRRHGDRFACAEATTWPAPTTELSVVDEEYGAVRVQAWTRLHPRPAARRRWRRGTVRGRAVPIVRGTVVRLTVQHPEPGTPQTMWLWTTGPDTPDLDLIWRAYLRRFAIEHTNRFIKQHLAWTTPAVRGPAQADRWSWLIAAAYTQLRLAKPMITDLRLPWEKPLTPTTLTPLRVRRGFRSLAPHLATPARPPKPSRPGPGRPPGRRNQQPTTRHKAIKKGHKKQKR
jgi:hypothetical protein